MWPFHPEQVRQAAAGTLKGGYPDLPLYENERVVNPKVSAADQAQLTGWYNRPRGAIHRTEHQPAPSSSMSRTTCRTSPLAVSEAFRGKSGLGLYADVILELDASVGRILGGASPARSGRAHPGDLYQRQRPLAALRQPRRLFRAFARRQGHRLRRRRAHPPCLMRWPGRIPAGRVCREMIWSMDLLPTLARLAGGAPPQDRLIGRTRHRPP